VIYGRNAVTEAIKSGGGVEKLLLQKNVEGEGKRIFALAKKARIPVQAVPKFVLDKETGGAAHQGVAAVVTDYVYSDLEDILGEARARGERPFVVVLDGIEDPHNLGAIIRSAEGAGVHGVVIPRQRAASVNGTVMKTSAGAAAYMKVAKVGGVKAALDELKEKGLWIYGLDMAGASYRGQDFDGGVCLVIGAEGSGLSRIVREACDFLVSVPMRGRMGSLNASAAAAVVLFEIAGRGGDSRLRGNDNSDDGNDNSDDGNDSGVDSPVEPANDGGGKSANDGELG
jgi:23S rRNA (guanosine2251-2'-O)-methyltransferase